MPRRNGWTYTGDLALIERAGDPRRIARELNRFKKSTRYFNRNEGELLREYPRWWIAILDGEVKAKARTQEALYRKTDRAGLPRGEMLVEYMDPDPKLFWIL